MDRLQAMRIFTRVVETNSFNKAAEALSLSPSSVTVSIKNLEEFLGVRLLRRTTRSLNLTLEGTSYYESCRNILTQIAETEAGFHMNSGHAKGALRLHMPAAIGRVIVLPQIQEFQSRYPDIDLTISLGDGAVDIIQDGLDLVVRSGELESSSRAAWAHFNGTVRRACLYRTSRRAADAGGSDRASRGRLPPRRHESHERLGIYRRRQHGDDPYE